MNPGNWKNIHHLVQQKNRQANELREDYLFKFFGNPSVGLTRDTNKNLLIPKKRHTHFNHLCDMFKKRNTLQYLFNVIFSVKEKKVFLNNC